MPLTNTAAQNAKPREKAYKLADGAGQGYADERRGDARARRPISWPMGQACFCL
jgi:hypothetical protein